MIRNFIGLLLCNNLYSSFFQSQKKGLQFGRKLRYIVLNQIYEIRVLYFYEIQKIELEYLFEKLHNFATSGIERNSISAGN